MPIKFYLLSTSIFSIIYLLTILTPKYITKYFCLLNEIFFKTKKEEKIKTHSLNKTYSFLLLFIPLWKSFVICYERIKPYNSFIFLGKHEFLYQCGIATFFFILGLLLANGKKIITCIVKYPIYLLKTISLTMTTTLLLILNNHNSKEVVILFSIINLIYLKNYYQTFKKKKESQEKWEFIYHFSWFLTINFLNSFILVFNILNK